MTDVDRSGSIATRRAGAAFLVGLALIAGGCTMPFEIRPLVAIDGEPLEVDAADPYERGKRFLRERRLGLAIQEFRATLARQPNSVMALNGVAIAYDELGRFDLAERYYHRALALQPDSSETLNNLGYSALRRGHAGRARTFLERARGLTPEDAIVLANLELARQPEAQAAPAVLADAAPAEPPYDTWVARLDQATQMLVTRPEPRLIALASTFNVHPSLFSLQPRE